jgi:hypothetical protein
MAAQEEVDLYVLVSYTGIRVEMHVRCELCAAILGSWVPQLILFSLSIPFCNVQYHPRLMGVGVSLIRVILDLLPCIVRITIPSSWVSKLDLLVAIPGTSLLSWCNKVHL